MYLQPYGSHVSFRSVSFPNAARYLSRQATIRYIEADCRRRDRNFWTAVYVRCRAAKPRTKLARNSRGGHKSAKSNHPLPTILSTIHPLFHASALAATSRSSSSDSLTLLSLSLSHAHYFLVLFLALSLSLLPYSPCLDMSLLVRTSFGTAIL